MKISNSTWKKMVIMSQYSLGIEFGGYITPSEAAAIADFPNVTVSSEAMFLYHMRKMAEGKSNPTWIYFNSRNLGVNALVREHCCRDHSQE